MARLHTQKVRQLGGIGSLALFLFLASSHYGEETGEQGLVVVILGGLVAFLAGYGLTPWLMERSRTSRPGSGKGRSGRRSSRRTP